MRDSIEQNQTFDKRDPGRVLSGAPTFRQTKQGSFQSLPCSKPLLVNRISLLCFSWNNRHRSGSSSQYAVMESIKSGWQELKTISGPKCPKLFYNFTVDDDGYTTQFTDLIGFWTAISPTVDIIDYAKITKASIDPSDSKAQLHVLLQKLCQSLAEGENTLRQADDGTNAILLQTVLKLPRPLQPLKWEFYFEVKGTEESTLR